MSAARSRWARAQRRRFLRSGVSSNSMKTCQSTIARWAAPAPTRNSIARRAAPPTSPLGWFAGTLALLVLGASPAIAQVGTNYCTPAVANSTGAPAAISGSGSAVAHLNDLVLTGSGLPLNAAAYFLCSRTQGFVQNPGGSAGNLCLANPIGRRVGGVIPNSGTTGIVNVASDLNVMPQPTGAVVVLPGEPWHFQCWYRDAVGGIATSNFSDGLAVLFTAMQTVPGMMPIPAGTFMMGSNAPGGAPYYNDSSSQPVHQVTISYCFWMGQHEVTQAEYQALMGSNPSHSQGASRPVERVSWHQARAYCAALTAQQAANLPVGYEYRLPTEAEWEYACRAATTTEFHYGPDLFCNQARFWYSYHSNSPCSLSGTVPVGGYAPNAFGLYDMHGNVWEWCLDSYAAYNSAAVTDPFVTGGPSRVSRGGSFLRHSSLCRSAVRRNNDPGSMSYGLGFRVVLAPALVP
jgi:formylglycine-generating enzyme required for sulfatase activity